jgi:hypothetical protein
MPNRTEQGHSVDFRYVAIIKLNPELEKIFGMSPDMATIPFGSTSMISSPSKNTFFEANFSL